MSDASYCGRFAPSPTGPLHPGSLLAALGSWLLARHAGGRWLVRVEDVDPPRTVPGAVSGQLAMLAACGLISDGPVVHQSQRDALYEAALERLLREDKAFVCHCSRSEVAAQGGIHHRCVARAERAQPAVRLRVPPGSVVRFDDGLQGTIVQDVHAEVGDVDSTPRQILLQQALGLPTPRHLHLPLLLGPDGRKLSKSEAALPIDPAQPLPALRQAWRQLGQDPTIGAAVDEVDHWLRQAAAGFDPARLPPGDISTLHAAGEAAPFAR